MPTPFILLFGLTVATCVIAYWSDNLGKKLGKKRISLFGLRPRQTATIITMASSWGIMLLTLAVLLAAWPPLYNALLRYDRVNESNKQARALNRQLTNDNTRLNTNLLSLQDLQKKLTTQVKKSQALVRKTEQSLRKSEAGLRTAQGNLRTAQRGEATAKRRAAAAQERSAGAQRRLAQAQRRLDVVQKSLQQNQERLRNVRVRLDELNVSLAKASKQLSEANKRLAKAREDYKQVKIENDKLSETNERLTGANERLTEKNLKASNNLTQATIELTQATIELNIVRANYEKLEKDVKELEGQRGTLLQQREVLAQLSRQLSTGEISFRGGQVLAESTVLANLGATETQQQLFALIERGREVVKQTKSSEGVERTLDIVLPVDGGVSINEADIVQQVANYLSLLNTPASVRLIVAMNHAQLDPVIYAHVRVVPIETRFVRGETITTGTIDGSLGDAGVFNQLLELVNNGEEIARGQKGIDPVPTPENPFFYATGTNERIFEALHKIQATGKKVRVRLVAAEDITTVDPLRVRFEVETPAA